MQTIPSNGTLFLADVPDTNPSVRPFEWYMLKISLDQSRKSERESEKVRR